MCHSPLRLMQAVGLLGLAACFLLPSYFSLSANAQNTKRLEQVTKSEQKSEKAQEPRLALVIGNGEYAGSTLKNPVNDARAMAALLKKQGFVVMEKENLTQTEMLNAIRTFGEKLDATPGAVALFYFSGHGLQAAGQNWLVPIAHGIHGERDVPDKAVSAQRVLDQMAGGRLNILILDACRDNPFIPTKSLGKGLAKMDAPGGTLIAYATAPGKTADDGEGENGLYTQELLKQMRTPGLKIEDVFKKTRVQVKNRSKGQQLPWEESSLENDFFFVPPRNKADKTGKTDNLDDGPEMITIPAGDFLMGDDDQSDNPRHTVYLDRYSISKNLVTVKEYMAFVKATGHAEPAAPMWGWKDNHPIVDVSWEDAQAYCAWLSKQLGRTVTLPTEAQWEKAARGTDGRKFPWGNDWDTSRLQHSTSKVGDAVSTAPVGSFPSGASPYGILDMAGNVFQWCLDWYDKNYLTSTSARNPTGPLTGTKHVVRGGSWKGYTPDRYYSASRSNDILSPAARDNIGFRVVSAQ